MVNKDMLKLMKDDAIIINTARGALIDEDALIDELKKDVLLLVGCYGPEPASADSPLRKLPNVLLTPHIAGAVLIIPG